MTLGARAQSLLGWLEVALLLLAALFALSFHLTLGRRLPQERDYLELGAFLGGHAQPGDVVLLYPWWTERARLFVPSSLPVVGYLGDEGDPLRAYSRIWVLAQPNLPRSDLKALHRKFLPARVAVGEAQRFGNLALTLYRNDLHRPRHFEAAASFAAATVYLESPDGERVECPFDGKAHRCPGKLYVAAEWHEISFQAHHCLWMHAPGGATKLVAEFRAVPARRWLRLQGGIIWDRALFDRPGLTTTYVGVDDEKSKRRLLEISLPAGQPGAQEAELAIPIASASALDVRLWVQSDNPEEREACVNLFSEDGAPADPS